MAFFDPAYRKMLARSPAYFQQSAIVWGPIIEASIIKYNASVAGDIFRAAVIGVLALDVAKGDPASWSSDAVDYIRAATQNSRKLMPATLQFGVLETATSISRMGDEAPTDTSPA